MRRWIDKLKPYKRIVAILFILLFTVLTEVYFNYPSIKEGYQELDISEYIEVSKKKKTENYVISYETATPIYIKELKVRGLFGKKYTYTIETTEINDFGKEETHTYQDYTSAWYTDYYTNLNCCVTSLRITIPKEAGDQIWTVSVSNEPEINLYRVAFTAAVLVVLYCIFMEEFFRKKIEYFFLVFSLLFGGLMLIFLQPKCSAWDEQIHFQNAYRLASGPIVEWNEATTAISFASTPVCNTDEEYGQVWNVLNEKGRILTETEEQPNLGIAYYALAYLPMAIFLKIGMMLELSFSNLYLLGKLGNLLVYVLAMFLAIRWAKRKKMFLLFLALMPTSLFLACSYTYDSTSFAWITLGTVLWANEIFEKKEQYKKGPVIVSLILFVAGGLAKFVYLPIILVILLMPQIMYINKKKKKVLAIGAGAICVLLLTVFIISWLNNILSGTTVFADARGGETDFAGQLISVMSHPWSSIKMLLKEIVDLENFRNSGNAAYNNFFVGNLMFLNYYLLGVMSDKWCILLIPIVLLLLLYREEAEEKQRDLSVGKRSLMIVVLMVIIALIWTSMYLAFTPVGDDSIAGVQARYYLPVVYFAALLVQNKNVFVRIRSDGVVKWTMLSAWIFATVSMYEFILKGRLF